MNCEEFRFAIGAEPNAANLQALEHAASCSDCARYRADMRAMDGLIRTALQVPIEPPKPVARPGSRTAWRMAASALLAAVLASAVWLSYPRSSLAEEIVEHVLHEPGALTPTASGADPAQVTATLHAAGVELDADGLNVSYAMSCPFRGRQVPHLVVQTERGPVTVLVLPEESSVKERREFHEGGFDGTLLPAPRGAIAVLSSEAPVDDVAQQVLSALRYL